MFGVCLVYENVGFGEFVVKFFIDLELENIGNYVLLVNIYVVVGRWEDVENMCVMINYVRLGKILGYSIVEVRVI